MKVPVAELKRRHETTLDIKPATNQAKVLRLLAEHDDEAYTPSAIAAETEVSQSSAPKVCQRLAEKGAVRCLDGYYFVNQEKRQEIRDLLVSFHQERLLAEMVEKEAALDSDADWGEMTDRTELTDEEVKEELAELEDNLEMTEET
jgi:DNA-binding MarR family transcriptional regulator